MNSKSKLHPRRNAREGVLQALYAQQFSDDEPLVILSRTLDAYPERKKNEDFISTLFHCVLDHVDWADDLIKSHLQNWEFNRVAQVDKVLLRMGICEIFYLDDIPPKVSISEMVEISKVYSTDESSGFINGILDAVYKDYQQQENN
ncbi:MAG: transcription antitermination factor NusB [Candidatus Marinimicrobia bacterium]|jgi:N utilization substance protein B|nr:transcription antitermination factor NusB [Candidatus Neomarinimicrobiota bacterium]MBT3500887.1 transcription antitermination factor NusB [Candidatus Neomarinimicrobiota bacterium]MBT3838921.1 transcription antitermination factor NusB [Candidatus Neomarinimicrobiota bacterium]MBT4000346.1 transcription antitermination factor NusB [Candidatus Neomarinimicrobiota bacterium]MBT4282696.1 transcription antitermination factor NusB [Candidatus Neomarinimicrobiota bacterium]